MGGVGFSVWGAAWSAGVVTLGDVFGGTTLTPVLEATGMNALTAGGAGTITLVAPSKVFVTTGNIVPIVGALTLTYVPEPGSALLLGAGAIGLGVLG
jgi:hypothetical protein